MRALALVSAAVCMSFSATAFADDEGEGWFDEDVQEQAEPSEEPVEAAPTRTKRIKIRRKRVKVVVDEDVEVTTRPNRSKRPPEWTRGRGGKYKRSLPAVEGEQPPPGYRLEYQNRKGLWIPGVVLLTTGYAVAAFAATTGLLVEDDCGDFGCGRRDWGWGFLPLVGPFVIAGDGDFEPGWRAGYALLGISQIVGLGLTIGGAASKRPRWILRHEHRDVRGAAQPSQASTSPELTVNPGFVSFKTAF